MDTRLSEMDGHLCKTVRAIEDLARICDAVRHTAGLGKKQMERVEKARVIADEAEQFLVRLGQEQADA